ncbi:Olfactory receptor 10G9 [Lemmus lemmus]
MASENVSSVKEFILLGLTQQPELQLPLFFLFLGIYVVSMVGNLGLIVLIVLNPHLHTPMYYFLFNLSFTDLCYSSVITPKMLVSFVKQNIISHAECMTQLFFFAFFVIDECFILTAMAYDRYAAICKPLLYKAISYPLRYSSLMSGRVCALLAAGTWLTGSLHSAVQTTLTFRLPYCGPNQIQHYFCDAPPILKLACADTSANEMVIFVNIGIVALMCFLLILTSYTRIVISILKIHSSEGRRRAFSTCSAHLTSIIFVYGPVILVYLRPASSPWLDSVVQVFNNVITPSLNPLIYTLRNKDVKLALKKVRDQAAQPLGDKE